MSDQMIFKRYEIKYLMSTRQAEQMKLAMAAYMEEDEHGRSTIQSLYLDTPDYLLARRSLEHPLYKEKLRLRSYGVAQPDTTVFLEIKKKYESVVYKRRIALTEAAAKNYLLSRAPIPDSQISREIDYCVRHYEGLAPKVLLSYERDAYYGKNDPGFRVTFDENILWRGTELNLTAGIRGEPLLDREQTLMEVKTGYAIPLWLTHFLTENRIRRASFSKYGSAYARICRDTNPAIPHTVTLPTADRETCNYENGGNYHYA